MRLQICNKLLYGELTKIRAQYLMAKRSRRVIHRARIPVQIEYKGIPYRGCYVIDGRTVTVGSIDGSATAQCGSTPAEVLAKMLLQAIAEKHSR